MYADRPENKHPLELNAWTACFLIPLLVPARNFDCFFWILVKIAPYVALAITVLIEYVLILYIEQIVKQFQSDTSGMELSAFLDMVNTQTVSSSLPDGCTPINLGSNFQQAQLLYLQG